MTQAILGNAAHPEYGVATIPIPIPRTEYANYVALLEALEIGDARGRDCQVQEICGPWPALKRLDSFSSGELAQFQALAEKWELRDMTDLINLSFCCQKATVITDFSDLESVGRRHYLNIHSGCTSVQELEDLDARETALLLIDSEAGTVTPYGVVYDNGATLEPVYDGQRLPCFTYAPAVLTVALRSRLKPDDTPRVTWLYLPTDEEQLHRTLLRSGIADPADFRFRLEDSVFPAAVEAVLDVQLESIYELNRLAQAVDRLSWDQRMKLGAGTDALRRGDSPGGRCCRHGDQHQGQHDERRLHRPGRRQHHPQSGTGGGEVREWALPRVQFASSCPGFFVAYGQ